MDQSKPILFNTEEVKAILDGRKTVTRRVIKPQPTNPRWNNIGWLGWDDGHGYKLPCLYKVGDILWVRETWRHYNPSNCDCDECRGQCGYPGYIYRADGIESEVKWRPSTHMPKEAARIFLEVTNVRAERLQKLTDYDARAEGIKSYWAEPHRDCPPFIGVDLCSNPRKAFEQLWDKRNKKRGYGWDTNPWVWVIEFERVE